MGKVTLNLMVANLMLRVDITFILVLIKSLPALTIFNPELIQMMQGVPLNANVLLNSW